MEHLLSSLDQGGLIGPHIAPLRARLTAILGTGEASAAEVRKRIRLLAFAPRKLPLRVLRGDRPRDAQARAYPRHLLRAQHERDVGARRFAAASRSLPRQLVPRWLVPSSQRPADVRDRRHRSVKLLDETAREVSVKSLEDYLATGYGIMRSGDDVDWAKLRFSAERARWVGSEVWHPDQRGTFDPAGRYTLELPYRDDRELVLEILKHGAGVEVLAPAELRTKVREAHLEAARINRRRNERARPPQANSRRWR